MDEPQNIMLELESETQKTVYCVISFYMKVKKSIEIESRTVVAQECGGNENDCKWA